MHLWCHPDFLLIIFYDMSAENKCEKQILHHQSHVIGLHYVPMESGVPQVSVLDPSIFIYILWSWYTSQPLRTSPYSICKWYHCIHVRVVVLGYKIHNMHDLDNLAIWERNVRYHCKQYFSQKKLLSRHVNQVGKSCWNGPMMVIF